MAWIILLWIYFNWITLEMLAYLSNMFIEQRTKQTKLNGGTVPLRIAPYITKQAWTIRHEQGMNTLYKLCKHIF